MDIKIFIYWVLVGLPLSWGLYKSVERSLPLFTGKPNTPTVAPAKPAATAVPAVADSPAPARTP